MNALYVWQKDYKHEIILLLGEICVTWKAASTPSCHQTLKCVWKLKYSELHTMTYQKEFVIMSRPFWFNFINDNCFPLSQARWPYRVPITTSPSLTGWWALPPLCSLIVLSLQFQLLQPVHGISCPESHSLEPSLMIPAMLCVPCKRQ
jgi:hypothetical protein